MSDYKPDYDTKLQRKAVVENIRTWHRDGVDWSYPFDDPEHTACMCCGEEEKKKDIEKRMEWLRLIESGAECFASTYGGWPRIWHRVYEAGMASQWPWWTPRPVVAVEGTFGTEWYDWKMLTGVKKASDDTL